MTTNCKIAQKLQASLLALTLALLATANAKSAEPRLYVDGGARQWSLDGVHHLIGLPGIKQRAVGKLAVASNGLRFETETRSVFVESANIINVSVGDERLLKGGSFGRFLRTGIPVDGGTAISLAHVNQSFTAIPWAAGFLASLATMGREDIITVEFLDPENGYHAAVFTAPWHAADDLGKNILKFDARTNTKPEDGNCSSLAATPDSLSLLPVASEGGELPVEYRALVYEHLFKRIQEKQPQLKLYRAGTSAEQQACTEWKLTITAEAFHKGDAAERALVGPAGLFVGVTSVRYRMLVTARSGASLIDQQIRAAIRGDNESLNLGDAMAKSINRKLTKLRGKTAQAAE